MPQEYQVLDVSRFTYRYARWGENLRNYSHPQVCTTLRLLTEEGQISVSEIHKELDNLGMPPSNLSSFLNILQENGHARRKGRVYELVNNVFYKRIYQASSRLRHYMKTKKWVRIGYKDVSAQRLGDLAYKNQEISDRDVASTAKVFSEMMYEETSNYLIHILLKKDLTFSEIVNIYQTNHGYISPDRLRYYISVRKLKLFDKQFQVFKHKNKSYGLSRLGSIVHKAFDEALDGYMRDSEVWMERLWDTPVENLISDITAIVHPTDPFFKILRLIEKSKVVLVQTDTIVGVISIKEVLIKMGKEIGNPGWWTYVTARDVMERISEKDFIDGKKKVKNIFDEQGGIMDEYYIVKIGQGKFGVLDMIRFQALLNST